MNNIVNLSQLISLLSKTTGTDLNTSRRFLKAFFSTIEDTLAKGDSVTIRNFGTFRRSDDPAFGVPEGVMFIPDEAFREDVNRPFSMFNAVELADTITEAELEPIPMAPPVLEDNVPDIVPPSETVGAVKAPEPEPAKKMMPEPVKEQEEKEPDPTPDVVPAEAESPAVQPIDQMVESPEIEEEEEVLEEDIPRKKSKLWLWITIGLVIGIGAGVTAAFLDPSIPEVIPYEFEETTPDTSNYVSEEVPVPAYIETAENSNEESRPTAESTVQDVTPVAATPQPSSASSAEPVYDTVSGTRYLAVMARQYYGKSSYWVFIYDANTDKISNPNRVAPGTRVRIPDKSELPGSTPAETQRIAEQRAKELQEKYR